MSFTPKPLVGALVGPTAVGKSAAALRWAEKTGGAILSMDAMQIYRGADIGTGKPTAEERARVLHGGMDLVTIGEPFSVADYLQHAETFLEECRLRRQPVLAVGGTGLYYRALTRGLSAAPRASESLRRELETLSVPELQMRLGALDPQGPAQLDVNNPRRLIRAIEVLETSGKPLRWWHAHGQSHPLAPNVPAWCLSLEKAALEERITRRVRDMFAAGWIEEAQELMEQYSPERLKAFSAIGYPEITRWLEQGALGAEKEKLMAGIATATRQYAKRQLTWFRGEPKLQWISLDEPDSADQLLSILASV